MRARTCGFVAATLFLAFVLVGAWELLHILPHWSCAGVVPSVRGGSHTVVLARHDFSGFKPTDCVQMSVNGNSGWDLGSARGIHTARLWTWVRLGIGAWIMWCLGMVFLALAVALLARRNHS